jgi:hypothetical protein
VSMVATDGHRLALAERRQAVADISSELRMLVPSKAVGQLRRLLGESDEKAEVNISKDDSHLFFSVGSRLLISRQLTGQFPTMRLCYRGRTTRSSSRTARWSGPRFGARHYLRMNIHTQCGFSLSGDGSKYSLQAASMERHKKL